MSIPQVIFPQKLKPGDEVRVVSPATSLAVIPQGQRNLARRALGGLGLRVTFSQHAAESDEFTSSSIRSRVEDLHAAFANPQVKAILTTLGGYNSNQLLRYLDYDLIRDNPKVFCGYSDITALQNAIFARTGLVTYSGPHFTTFAMQKGIEYTLDHFVWCLMEPGPYGVLPAPHWSNDAWYQDQENRVFHPNTGYQVIRSGRARGRLLGGNLSTIVLLNGTEYMPSLEGTLLLLEDDGESTPPVFDRQLQSLIHQPGFSGVRGLIIGRFEIASGMTPEKLRYILGTKKELTNIPIVTDASFGHTTPQFTFPVGGIGELIAGDGQVQFSILQH